MARLTLQRLLGSLFSLWIVITFVFFALHLLPGDPVEAALSQSTAPPEVIEQRRAALGLHRPLFVQYVSYLVGLVQGHWGISWSSGQRVEVLVFSQVPPTFALASFSMLVAVTFGFLWGYGSAVSQWSVVSWFCDILISVALGTPVMLSGILLIWLFALQLDWLPATGQRGMTSLILPSLAVGFSSSGATARSVAAALRHTLTEPFMITARAKGLSYHQSVIRHALKSALPPVIGVLAIQFGYLAAGAIVAEGVFARQGLGRLLLHSVLDQDLPVVQAVVILTAAAYIFVNLLADVLHAALDPRIRMA